MLDYFVNADLVDDYENGLLSVAIDLAEHSDSGSIECMLIEINNSKENTRAYSKINRTERASRTPNSGSSKHFNLKSTASILYQKEIPCGNTQFIPIRPNCKR